MKTQNIFIIALLLITVLFQSCSDDHTHINGHGSIVTEVLNISDFSKLEVRGVDNVHISFGDVQKVEVEGHQNIIDRIKTRVINETWYAELENGSYGHYELTYYVTLPEIESIGNSGTGNIFIEGEKTQESIVIQLSGTGNYYGYSLNTEDCKVTISGTGSAEVTATSTLDVNVEGTGSVYYKGHPDISSTMSGTGKIKNEN